MKGPGAYRRERFAPGAMRKRRANSRQAIPATFMVISLRDVVVTHAGGKQTIEKVTVLAQDPEWTGPLVSEINLSALERWSEPL